MSIEARFDIRRGEFRLVIDLSLPGTGITSVFGPSGCGKTSLLRAIAGLDRHPGGCLRVGDLAWQADRTFVPPHRRALGYVFQEPSLFQHLDVRRNLEYGERRVHPRERRASLDQAIDLLGIGPLLARRPQTLSGGEMQRVAIARALAASPRLLLLDEPMAALDLARRQEVLPYLESLHRELDIPVIHVSHAPEEVARLADHLVLLGPSGVVGSGPLASLLTRFDLPLAHGADAAALVEAVVTAHDEQYHLTYLQAGSSRFTVLHRDLPPGTRVRLRIAARDVSLARDAHSGSSILNILPMTVMDLAIEDAAQVTVGLESEGVRLLARVTRKSVAALDIQPGQRIWAQVKGIALLQ